VETPKWGTEEPFLGALMSLAVVPTPSPLAQATQDPPDSAADSVEGRVSFGIYQWFALVCASWAWSSFVRPWQHLLGALTLDRGGSEHWLWLHFLPIWEHNRALALVFVSIQRFFSPHLSLLGVTS
jgi:hypothetical protein